MPVTVSAAKALRRDRRRTLVNRRYRRRLKMTLDQNQSQVTPASLKDAYQILDRAAKVGVIHPNKAARIKSRLSKQLQSQPSQPKAAPVKPQKTSTRGSTKKVRSTPKK